MKFKFVLNISRNMWSSKSTDRHKKLVLPNSIKIKNVGSNQNLHDIRHKLLGQTRNKRFNKDVVVIPNIVLAEQLSKMSWICVIKKNTEQHFPCCIVFADESKRWLWRGRGQKNVIGNIQPLLTVRKDFWRSTSHCTVLYLHFWRRKPSDYQPSETIELNSTP